jgi:hypothetical protein
MMNPRVWASLLTCAAKVGFGEAAAETEFPDAIAMPPRRVNAFREPLDAISRLLKQGGLFLSLRPNAQAGVSACAQLCRC